MIISCSNCNKRFKIDASLIPAEGRDLKCGSCDHVWFYEIEDKNLEPLSLKEDIIDRKIERTNEVKKSSSHSKIDIKDKKDLDKIVDKQSPSKNKSGKFFSYIIVFIISFVALIILIDTLKIPLINVFPGLETIFFSLFEMLKDIKLFIMDLY